MNDRVVLVNLASGIGNILLATPLLAVLGRNGFTIDLLIDADYEGVDELFSGWGVLRNVYTGRHGFPRLSSYELVLAAIPPFYWRRFRTRYARLSVHRPPDELFYQNEQEYYLAFAASLGCDISEAPYYFLPSANIVSNDAIILAPGSKPAEMATKRWPYFAELAARLDNVVLIGTNNDLLRFNQAPYGFPSNVSSFIGRTSLADVAALIAGSKLVVANDAGLGHLAGALGVPTILLFGPTPHKTLGPLPPNVRILRSDLECQPCWFAARFLACHRHIDCLAQLRLETVLETIDSIMLSAVSG